MKFVKILLGIIAVLAIIFFGMGLITPTINYTTEVEVNKPLTESWAVFMDESKLDQWVLGLKSMELVSGTKNEVGAIHNLVMEHNGQDFEMTEELTALKEMEQYAMTFESESMTNNVDVRFAAKDDNTTVITTNTDFAGKGIFMRSVMAFMKGGMKAESAGMYDRLKTLIEDNTTDYFPVQEAEAGVMEAESTEAAAAEEVQ